MMKRFEEILKKPRCYRSVELASKIGSYAAIPLILAFIFAPSWTLRLWAGGFLAAAALSVVMSILLRDLYISLAVMLLLSPFLAAVGTVALSAEKDYDPFILLLTAPLFVAGVVFLLRWLRAKKEPIQSITDNDGAAPVVSDC